jgi:predicted transcriptional regulator of viral defense system
MSRLVSAPFFSAHPVFRRAEYAAAVGRTPSDKVVTAMLAQHLRAGNVKRIARGVFASVPKHVEARKWSVDRFLAASRLRRGAVIGYHSALELHGCAYTEGYEVQVIAPGEPGVLEASGFSCRFVRPPHGSTNRKGKLTDGVMVVDRMGLDVRVTTIERTIADLFDRYELAGGTEELFNSLDLVPRVDAVALVRHIRARDNAAATGALGYWLEREQRRLGVPDTALDALHAIAPRQARYALGAKPGEGRTAKGWNVILPFDVVERRFEGL